MKEVNTGKKQIGINMAANIVAYSSNLLVSFILTPFLIDTIGKETYSFYPIANSMVVYMSVLMNAMNTMASRFVTIALVRDQKEEANKYFSSVLAANSIIGLVVLIPMIVFVVFMERFMQVPINSVAAVKLLFALVFSSALINIFASIFGISTFAKNRIDLRSLREIVTGILRLVLFVLLYKFLSPSIVYVGVVAIAIALVNTGFQMVYTKKLLPEIKIKRSYMSWKYVRELLGSSVWNMINSVGNAMLVSMTIVLANIFYGASASGSCSIVQIIPSFISGVISMLVGVFFPIITYQYAQNDIKSLTRDLKNTQKIIGGISCATIVVFSAMAKDFYFLWTPQENSEYLAFLSFFMLLPQFFVSCFWELTNLNIVMNKVKTPALVTLLMGVLNIVLVAGLDTVYHDGVEIILIISAVLQIIWIGIFMPLYACKNLKIKWYSFYPALIRAILCGGITYFFVFNIRKLIVVDSWFDFILWGGLMGILGLAVFFIGMIGFKHIKDFKRLIKK